MQGSKGDTDAKKRLLDLVGGERGMIWENMYTTVCKIDNQCKFYA